MKMTVLTFVVLGFVLLPRLADACAAHPKPKGGESADAGSVGTPGGAGRNQTVASATGGAATATTTNNFRTDDRVFNVGVDQRDARPGSTADFFGK